MLLLLNLYLHLFSFFAVLQAVLCSDMSDSDALVLWRLGYYGNEHDRNIRLQEGLQGHHR